MSVSSELLALNAETAPAQGFNAERLYFFIMSFLVEMVQDEFIAITVLLFSFKVLFIFSWGYRFSLSYLVGIKLML